MALISDSVFDASALGFPSAVGTQSGKLPNRVPLNIDPDR